MGFDPDAYLKQTQAPTQGFDPDAYLKETAAPVQKESGGVSAVRKAVQGATAGFSDELAGGVEAIGQALGKKGAGGAYKDIADDDRGPTLDWEVLRDAYKRGRDRERDVLKKDSKDNPKISAVAELGGTLISPVNKIMPGASIVKQGAASGAIMAAGGSEAESVGKLAADTAAGGIFGAGLGKAAQVASPLIQKGVSKVGSAAGDLAERFGVRALGGERATIDKLGIKKSKEAARQAIDEGIFKLSESTEDLARKNAAVKARGGKMMGDVYDQIDAQGASTFNPQKVAEKVNEEVGGFWRSAINKGETKQFENTLESILVRGESNIPMREAQALKNEIDKVANWKSKNPPTDKEQIARSAVEIIKNTIDESAAAGAETIGTKGLKEALDQGRKLYGNASTAGTFIKNKVSREAGNNLMGLTDWIAASGAGSYGAATGDVEGAAAAFLAKKGLQKYGLKAATLGFDKVSKALAKAPEFAALLEKNPAAFNAIVKKFEAPGAIERFLPKAAENDDPPTKGPQKWANDGIEMILKSDQSDIDRETLEKLKETKRGQMLLEEASSAKNKKAMESVLKKIRSASSSKGAE
jgi:hypothetical protein